jgi:hypothetical protein
MKLHCTFGPFGHRETLRRTSVSSGCCHEVRQKMTTEASSGALVIRKEKSGVTFFLCFRFVDISAF